MSLESIALIAVLTLLILPLGTDLFLLFIGCPALDAVSDATMIDVMTHIHRVATFRIPVLLTMLMVGGIFLNVTKHTRTEIYLLRIGLVTLVIYAMLVVSSSKPLIDRMIAALETGSVDAVRQWYGMWQRWLWLRAAAALVSFWSFLHYAMNPKV